MDTQRPEPANTVGLPEIGPIIQGIEKASEFIDSPDAEMRAIGKEILTIVKRNLRDVQHLIESSTTSDAQEKPGGYISAEEEKQMQEDMWALEIFDRLKDGMHDGVFTADADGNISMVNRAVEGITGYQPDELVGMSFATLIHPDDIEGVIRGVRASATDDHDPQEFRIIAKDGSIRWVRTSTYLISSASEASDSEVAGLIVDITETKELQEKLEKMSLYDPLTELPNRHYLDIELERLRVSRRYPVSFINIDIDDFKRINDSLGHAEGDNVLVKVSWLLRYATREDDFIARTGGDEFLIPLPNADEDGAKELIERIDETVDRYNQKKKTEDEIDISLSIGVSTASSPDEFDSAQEKADQNMYKAKREKKEAKARSQLKTQLDGFPE